ncbi:hypothetical protein ACFWD7_57750 [Streptomyces mirabilis]|uniref:hypothetical protein n=1 Tax=Streptomyces mirabilis TaxID=68239 RepID=UPI0036AA3319
MTGPAVRAPELADVDPVSERGLVVVGLDLVREEVSGDQAAILGAVAERPAPRRVLDDVLDRQQHAPARRATPEELTAPYEVTT